MKCEICNKSFGTIHQVSAHKKVHSPNYEKHKAKTVKRLNKISKEKANKFKKQYEQNPKICIGCGHKIPIEKYRADRKVKYCSRSCATTYTNQQRAPRTKKSRLKISKKMKIIKHNPTKPVVVGPFTKVFLCNCKHCGIRFYKPTQIKYCDVHSNLYKSNNRNKYAFTFSLSKYPDLFSIRAQQLKEHGLWSYSNTTGLTRDHKVSVNEAIKFNYDPFYIKHPLNCELMSWTDNNKKKVQSSISYEELIRQVNAYESING